MSHMMQFVIGSDVTCRDGGRGELTRVVIDPVAKALTHLVVAPRDRPAADRLVPVGLVTSASDVIALSCTTAEFDDLERADETEFLPGAPGQWGYGAQQLLSYPYYSLAGGVTGAGLGRRASRRPIAYDRVPLGEVQVRRGEPVHAQDGIIGRVQGLVMDPSDHHVTHVLLDEGHLWGQRRVAIPISAVAGIDRGVQLKLTKDDIRDLPPVDLEPWQ